MQINILDYLYETAERLPDKEAFCDGTNSLNFKEVLGITESIGSYLIDREIYNSPVFIFMKRSPEEVAAFFGVIAGGNYYVPIDPDMPESRIQLIIEEVTRPIPNCDMNGNTHNPSMDAPTKKAIMICDEDSVDRAKAFDFNGEIVEYKDISAYKINRKSLDTVREKAVDTDCIYIVFTSGSTGVPKGVVACHRSVIDYVTQLSETLGFDEDTIFGSQTPLFVDACLKEIIPTIKYGATTYLIPRELFKYPVKLVEYLNKYRINTICWVVSALVIISSLNTFKTIKPKHLRLVAFGSEIFPIKQFNRWVEAVPAAYFNLYGPTEATGMSCFYKVDRTFEPGDVIPIGRPFKNTKIILLDENDNIPPEGEPGEICIGGTCLTLGYYNNPEMTEKAFVQNPLNPHYSEIIYRTGDLGRVNNRGELEFISRKDYQIKHMGYRIELGEIEANASSLENVEMTGCIYDEKKSRIVLFYTGTVEESNLGAALKKLIPEYTMPSVIIKLSQMPLTSNGKIDRRGLRDIYET